MVKNHIDAGRNISLRRGDTMEIVVAVINKNDENWRAGVGDRIVFGVKNGVSGEELFRQVLEIGEDRRARMVLQNNVSKKLPVGRQLYDVRFVQEANADATDGSRVFTPFVRYFAVLDVVSEI